MPYSYMLDATNLSSLSSRRDDLSRNFFLSITNPASCLRHLLPPPRSIAVTSMLRSYEIYPRPSTRDPYKVILFPRAIWPFSLLETESQQLTYIHPSPFICWRFQLLTAVGPIIIIPITIIVLGLLPYITFLPFYLIVLIQT